MSFPYPSPVTALVDLAAQYLNLSPDQCSTIPIIRGASGRTIVRIAPTNNPVQTYIGIAWNGERADNATFVPAAQFLKNSGIRVPTIFVSHDWGEGCGGALITDLGDICLLLHKEAPWKTLKAECASALTQLHALHQLPEPDNVTLQPPFDASLYRWEQEYFAQYVIHDLCGCDPTSFLSAPVWTDICQELAQQPRCLIHRDFQSQNIHIVGGQAWLIDFQGMRMGLAEYDLASFVFDPYMSYSPEHRQELLNLWETISSTPFNSPIFQFCAIQRLMQATAAYARYGLAGHIWYASCLKPALDILSSLSQSSPVHSVLSPVLHQAYSRLPLC